MKIWKYILFLVSFLVLLIGFLIHNDHVFDICLPNAPDWTFTERWGLKDTNETDVTSIKIKVPEETLNILKNRIKNRNSAPSFPDSKFKYGFNVEYLNSLMNHWANDYQWRQWESIINQFPQYFTTIKGLKIHFIYIKPVVKPNQIVIPLLLLHGWPGSFFEFYKFIPLLSISPEASSLAFEIVCPSLVGFGWSDGIQEDFSFVDTSDILFELMNRLNITRKFYIQGGDFGAVIAGTMAKIKPEKLAGIHVNMVEVPLNMLYLTKVWIGSLLPAQFHFLNEDEIKMVYPWTQKMKNIINQMGYMWLQATRPSTIGIALSDTPTGLAAYIIEKFGSWSNNLTYHLNSPNGGIENLKISKDEMLTNVMIYYITNSISTSFMMYKEIFSEINMKLSKIPIRVPAGIASFPHDLIQVPRYFANIQYRDLRQFTYMPRGGHFAALEEPELLVKDVLSFIKLVESSNKNLSANVV